MKTKMEKSEQNEGGEAKILRRRQNDAALSAE